MVIHGAGKAFESQFLITQVIKGRGNQPLPLEAITEKVLPDINFLPGAREYNVAGGSRQSRARRRSVAVRPQQLLHRALNQLSDEHADDVAAPRYRGIKDQRHLIAEFFGEIDLDAGFALHPVFDQVHFLEFKGELAAVADVKSTVERHILRIGGDVQPFPFGGRVSADCLQPGVDGIVEGDGLFIRHGLDVIVILAIDPYCARQPKIGHAGD